MPELINDITKKNNMVIIYTAIMDGSYDSKRIFNFLSFNGIIPAIIKVRNNLSGRMTNYYLRNTIAKMHKCDPDKWNDGVSYCQRRMSGTILSSINKANK